MTFYEYATAYTGSPKNSNQLLQFWPRANVNKQDERGSVENETWLVLEAQWTAFSITG